VYEVRAEHAPDTSLDEVVPFELPPLELDDEHAAVTMRSPASQPSVT
jgi:hypothetical protein